MSRSRVTTHATVRTGLTRRGLLGAGFGTAAGLAMGPLSGTAVAATTRDPERMSAACANDWLKTLYNVIWAEGPSPTNAARLYAYCAIAMFESVVPASSGLRSVAGQLNGLGALPKPPPGRVDVPCVLAGSVSAVAESLFAGASEASQQAFAETFAAQVGARKAEGIPTGVMTNSVDHGRRLGKALAAWTQTDGHSAIVGRPYAPPVGPDRWRPTPPNFGIAIEPYWSEVRPMVLRGGSEVSPLPHVPFSTADGSPFWEQAQETFRVGLTLTEEQKRIAMFWRDNPVTSALPSGHWMQIVRQVSEQYSLSLSQTVEAYVRLGVTLHDAFLNCWTWKYRYNLLRPVTYVHDFIQAGVPESEKWRTWVNTPQFPEYTSGHSVASRAASTVLTDLLGAVRYVDRNDAAPGGDTRRFDSFRQAADEAAVSRLYGGIHYPMGIENGKTQGDAIGALVIGRLQTRR